MSLDLSDLSHRDVITTTQGVGSQDKLFGSINQIPDAKSKGSVPNRLKPAFQIEKVTGFRLALFTLYTASLLIIISLRADFSKQLEINTAISEYYLNEMWTEGTVTTLNSSKMAFSDINDLDSLTNFIRFTVIYGMFLDTDGNLILGDSPGSDVVAFQCVSSFRMLQKRALLIPEPDNQHFQTKWDLHGSSESTAPYGSPSNPFQYNGLQGSF